MFFPLEYVAKNEDQFLKGIQFFDNEFLKHFNKYLMLKITSIFKLLRYKRDKK